jgi:hypothetical protein
MLEEGQKRWKKKIEGNKRLAEVKNPLRNFVEKEIPSIDLSQFPNRPQKNINLSIGDPTVSEEFRYLPLFIQDTSLQFGNSEKKCREV